MQPSVKLLLSARKPNRSLPTILCMALRHYPTLAPPGGLTLHIEKLLNSSFSINLCLKHLAPFSYIYPTKEPSLNR